MQKHVAGSLLQLGKCVNQVQTGLKKEN